MGAAGYGGLDSIKVELSHNAVYRSLRDAITSGRLPAGKRLIETHLAAQLGVSRAPLREAIRFLEREGLLTSLPYRGVQVAVLSEQDVAEIYGLRAALECWAVREVCMVATPADLAGLIAMVDAMERVGQCDGAVGKLSAQDEAFHRRICEVSRNRRVLEVWMRNRTQIQLLSAQSTARVRTDLLQIPHRHRAICEAICMRAPDNAERIVREHITSAASRVFESFASVRLAEM